MRPRRSDPAPEPRRVKQDIAAARPMQRPLPPGELAHGPVEPSRWSPHSFPNGQAIAYEVHHGGTEDTENSGWRAKRAILRFSVPSVVNLSIRREAWPSWPSRVAGI